MNESNSPEQNGPIERGHEPDAVNARLIMLSGGGLVLLMALGLLLVLGILRWMDTEQQSVSGQPPVAASTPIAAGPQLSADLPQQLHELRQAEEQQLSSYQWIDRQDGIARIPIDRAMEILAKSGIGF